MGQGRPFVLWGPDHLAVLALTIAGTLALVVSRGRLRQANDVLARLGLAALLLANEVIAWGWAAAQGVVRVPLQLCDLALLLTVWALWPHHLSGAARGSPADAQGEVTTPSRVSQPLADRQVVGWSLRRGVSVVAYFWGLSGSLQAILTPDLRQGFPDYWWVKFFLTHCGVVLSVVYLAVTDRVAPTARSVWRVWALTNAYAAIAGLINWGFGTNYGYLARKPMQPSLLDYFGPWPWYILVLEAAALASFFLYYAPFVLAQRFRSGRAS